MLSGVVYLPNGNAKGLFHVVHGMTEHIGRYDKFLFDMASEGYIAFGYDNLGHGKTANNDSDLGYIAPKNGWELLCKDVKVYSDAVRAQYASPDTPLVLMGHSMGSFIARIASQRFVQPQRLIIMGTGGPNPAAGIATVITGAIKRLKGERHVSKFANTLMFGSYNKKFGKTTITDPKLWLTNDESVRKKYYADKYCTFDFTISSMGDLVRLLKYANCNTWYDSISSKMPIILLSGENDPVGNYGKGVKTVESKLKKNGKNVFCKLYKNARHEILNDFTYGEVKNDILKFLGN